MHAPAMNTGGMDVRSLMLREGCPVGATGRVIAVDGQVWFEPPLPERLVLYAPWYEPAPRWSGLGVPVRGVDLDRLDRRRLKDGALEGWAQLVGHWTGGELVVGVMMARPSPTQVVLVVVSTEPDRTRQQLGSRSASRSCVVASRWTRTQVQGVQSQLEARRGGWQIYQTGQTHGEDCQIRFEVEAVQVVPEFAAWASTVPDGLLQVRAWLWNQSFARRPA